MGIACWTRVQHPERFFAVNSGEWNRLRETMFSMKGEEEGNKYGKEILDSPGAMGGNNHSHDTQMKQLEHEKCLS